MSNPDQGFSLLCHDSFAFLAYPVVTASGPEGKTRQITKGIFSCRVSLRPSPCMGWAAPRATWKIQAGLRHTSSRRHRFTQLPQSSIVPGLLSISTILQTCWLCLVSSSSTLCASGNTEGAGSGVPSFPQIFGSWSQSFLCPVTLQTKQEPWDTG